MTMNMTIVNINITLMKDMIILSKESKESNTMKIENTMVKSIFKLAFLVAGSAFVLLFFKVLGKYESDEASVNGEVAKIWE